MGIWAWGIWALAELGGIQVTELLWRMGRMQGGRGGDVRMGMGRCVVF